MTTQFTRTRSAESSLPPVRTTLLELVSALSEITESEEETVTTVLALLDSGEVQLIGNFRNDRLESLFHSLTLTS
jgi:hypothetical protein